MSFTFPCLYGSMLQSWASLLMPLATKVNWMLPLVLVGDQQCVNRVSRVFQFATHSILASIRLEFFVEIFQIMHNCLIRSEFILHINLCYISVQNSYCSKFKFPNDQSSISNFPSYLNVNSLSKDILMSTN